MTRIAFVDDSEWARPFVERHIKNITSYEVLDTNKDKFQEPQIVFFGDGKKGVHKRFRKSKLVFITCEDLYPDFSKADFIISCRYVEHDRYLRMPYWALINEPESLLKDENYAHRILIQKREFCAFVQSNSNPRRTRRRLDFFKALNQRRFVHSGGSTLNNLGYKVNNIHDFLSNFKFYICFENRMSEGYTTEKLVNAMRCGCIPIYWGDPQVHLDFNPNSFINAVRFRSDSDLIDHVEKVADDEDMRRAYLEQPFYHENRVPTLFDIPRIETFFCKVLTQKKQPRAFFSLKATLEKLKHRIEPYVPMISN